MTEPAQITTETQKEIDNAFNLWLPKHWRAHVYEAFVAGWSLARIGMEKGAESQPDTMQKVEPWDLVRQAINSALDTGYVNKDEHDKMMSEWERRTAPQPPADNTK